MTKLKAIVILIAGTITHLSLAATPCEERFAPQPSLSELQTVFSHLSQKERAAFSRPSIGFVSLEDPHLDFAGKLARSYEKPQALFSPGDPLVGGSSVFHGNIFVEGYFRTEGLSKRATLDELKKNQPWLKWNASSRTYTLEHGGTQEALLHSFVQNGSVRLYRGVGTAELALAERAKSGDRAALTQLFRDHALFFTPDAAAAQKWARAGVIEVSVPSSRLSAVYAGIETDYVEVAIPNGDVFSLNSLGIH